MTQAMARAVERRRSESASVESLGNGVRVRGFSGSGLGQVSVEFDVRTLYDFVFSLSEEAGSTDDLPAADRAWLSAARADSCMTAPSWPVSVRLPLPDESSAASM